MRPIVFALLLCLACQSALAEPIMRPVGPPGLLCRQAIDTATRTHAIPPGLLAAIGRVESGRHDPVSGATNPWPWTVDAEGQGAFYDSKEQAIAAVSALQARGVKSIDVGCMQVNLLQHPGAFNSLEQAFDPTANADYAARFLGDLHVQSGAWPKAAGLYHSATPDLGAAYQQKVMAIWPEEQLAGESAPRTALAQAWGATLSPGLSPSGFLPTPRRSGGARIIPQMVAGGGTPLPGRGLDAYRAAPIALGWRRVGG
jgi:hypothetical protein